MCVYYNNSLSGKRIRDFWIILFYMVKKKGSFVYMMLLRHNEIVQFNPHHLQASVQEKKHFPSSISPCSPEGVL